MTEPEPRLTPAQEEEVRHLLADARHAEPMPPEVAARLDRVLEGLADERAPAAPVVSLATRRRRATRLLVAAAAVVAIGIALGQILPQAGGPDSMDTGESFSADRGAAGEADSPGDNSNGPLASEAEDGRASQDSKPPDETYAVRPRKFSRDVSALRSTAWAQTEAELEQDLADLAAGVACRSDTWGAGTFVPVRYGALPGVLVFRSPQGDTQVADLFLCGDEVPTRSVTLPAP